MLKAIDVDDGKATLGWHASRKGAYTCPECRERVILKMGTRVIHHFAHRKKSTCAHGAGESARHLNLKVQMGTYFQAAMGGSVDYEVKLIPNRRADLVIDGKIVVECQVSPISDKDWWQRTADYTAAGYPVIWIWNHARLCHVTQWDAAKGRVVKTGTIAAEGRVPSEMLATQRAGSVVYIAHDNGTVEACQFREIQRPCLSCDGTGHRTSGWDAANGQRWRLRCKYCVRGQVTLQRVAIDRKVMPRYFSGFACTMPLMLYFAAIDLSKASVENYLGVEGIYPDRVQL